MDKPSKKPSGVLRRCSLCQNYHASYLVPNPSGGNDYYCYTCWKAKFKTQEASGSVPETPKTTPPDGSESD